MCPKPPLNKTSLLRWYIFQCVLYSFFFFNHNLAAYVLKLCFIWPKPVSQWSKNFGWLKWLISISGTKYYLPNAKLNFWWLFFYFFHAIHPWSSYWFTVVQHSSNLSCWLTLGYGFSLPLYWNLFWVTWFYRCFYRKQFLCISEQWMEQHTLNYSELFLWTFRDWYASSVCSLVFAMISNMNGLICKINSSWIFKVIFSITTCTGL